MEKISFQIYEERRKLCMAESVRRDRDDDFRYEIVRHFGILSTSVKGWTKEFNSVSWNGSTPKYDIRDWSAEHQHMSRGITMTREELEQLAELISAELGEA